jgi:hypothetical protein
MKTPKTLSSVAIAFATVLALASCNQSDDITPDGPQAVQFTAGIGEQTVATPQNRAAGTEWHVGDAIGIFMVKNKETAIASTYAGNKRFTTERGNLFLPESGHEIYYPLDADNHVDFYAYYPYTTTEGLNIDSKIDVSTADQSKQREFDMMWAMANNNGQGYNKNAHDNVPLVFAHCLARITMNCKFDPSSGIIVFDEAAKVTIKGMNTATIFAVKDGTIGTATTEADIVARKSATTSGYAGTFDAIIVPAKYAAKSVTVEFYVNSEIYTWIMDATEFEPGNDYVYDVIITRTGVRATGSINPWNTITEGTVWAE